jgi:soluble lytic murein transglycosylase
VWARHPTLPQADEAERKLSELEQQLGTGLRTAERYRRRADSLYRERHNEEALEAYETALALGALQPNSAARAARQRAYTLFRLRRYTEAAKAFEALKPDAETRIDHARAIARAGDVPTAAKELERIAKQERGHNAARARLLAALLWEGEDEPDRARELFAELARSARNTGYGTSALWRLGWEAYRTGQYDEALDHFEALGAAERDPIAALQARYWSLRAKERAGQEGAGEGFRALAAEYPLSYYGWRASQRATPGGEATPPSRLPRGKAVLSPRELARPRILLEAGLLDFARAELDRLFVRARGLDDRLALAELYADAGEYHRPQRLMVDAYQESLARGPAPGPVELWWHAWPVPFREAVKSAMQGRSGLEPELVYAIMREESGYRPEVLSVSGAVGLLQLMPDTARRVAAREALAQFSVDDLVLPAVNIRLGAAYLDELLLRFSGNATAAIGSYNAGPHRVVKWLAGAPLEDDEWVETIPFQETRGYVKRVLRSMHAYRVLY